MVRPARAARGAKGDRLSLDNAYAFGYAAQETVFERAWLALAPRLRWHAGQDVAAQAGIQPDHARRTPLTCRASGCSVDARRAPAPTPGNACQALLPVPTSQGQSKPR